MKWPLRRARPAARYAALVCDLCGRRTWVPPAQMPQVRERGYAPCSCGGAAIPL